MANYTDIYDEKLQMLIARALADKAVGLIATGADLPSPIDVLTGESEESITCYFSFPQKSDTSRMIAVKHVLSPQKRSRLWASVETARHTPSSSLAPLLPIPSNIPT
jgi:hypothetical protein